MTLREFINKLEFIAKAEGDYIPVKRLYSCNAAPERDSIDIVEPSVKEQYLCTKCQKYHVKDITKKTDIDDYVVLIT